VKIIFIRNNEINLDSRALRTVDFLELNSDFLVTLQWNRSLSGKYSSDQNSFNYPAMYNNGIRNMLPQIFWQFFIFKRIIKIRPDLIYACDLDCALVPFLLKPFLRCKLVFDEYDPITARGIRIIRSFLKCLEFLVYFFSDLLIFPTEERARSQRRKSLVIENIFILNSHFKTRSQYLGRYRAVYLGSLLNDRMLETVASCFEQQQDWSLILGGTGKPSLELLKSNNVTFVGTFTKFQFESYMRDTDLVLAFYDPSFSHNQKSASNKLSEAMAFGKQIVTNHGTALSSKVLADGLGWVINYGNEQELAEVLLGFAMQKQREFDMFRESSQKVYREMIIRYNNQLKLLSSNLSELR
jgi:glycosyltransferase involved in cell wall biosynthesis